jgi:hypothetical protein
MLDNVDRSADDFELSVDICFIVSDVVAETVDVR